MADNLALRLPSSPKEDDGKRFRVLAKSFDILATGIPQYSPGSAINTRLTHKARDVLVLVEQYGAVKAPHMGLDLLAAPAHGAVH